MKSKNLILILFILSFVGCNKKDGELEFGCKVVAKFGEEDTNKEGWIGTVGDIAINKFSEVFIVDLGTKKIKMYNKDGKFIKDYGKGEGAGPGEFVYPFSLAIDENNTLYVADMSKREIVIIDSNNCVTKIVKTKFQPCNVIVTKPGVFYVSGVHITYKGNLVYKYDINNKDAVDEAEMSFCERPELERSNLALKNSICRDGLTKDNKGNIYYCYSYPYEVRYYSGMGNLLNKYQRNVFKFDPPYYKQIGDRNVTIWDNGITDPMILQENLLCIHVLQNELGKEFFDFYNTKDSTYLGHINTKSLGFEQAMTLKSDGKGNIYYSQSDPYPHMVKMNLKLRKQM